jgi:ATP phosphoribosyltransferase regulatory subunit
LLCDKYGVSATDREKLLALISAYGKPSEVLKKLAPYCKGEAKVPFEMLTALCGLLEKTEYADNIRLDFSVVNDMNYYNDVVFKGFIDGVGEGVLSGGRYDKLMSRMGRKSGAIGFAVYLDLLEGVGQEKRTADVDVLVLYDDADPLKLLTKVQELTEQGKTVRVQKSKDGLRFGEVLDLTGGKQ